MSFVVSDFEKELLNDAAEDFGGSQSLGRGSELNGMDSFTLSVTFDMNTLSGGTQALLWNTQQYGIVISNDDLYVYLRNGYGGMSVVPLRDVFTDTGWHDVQVVSDEDTGELSVWVDGEEKYSGSNQQVDLGGRIYSDVLAGKTQWGHQFDGQIADVSIHDEAKAIDGSQSIYDRMYDMDVGDNAIELEDPRQDDTAAVVSGDDTGVVKEDVTSVISGKLDVSDSSADQEGFISETFDGLYGELSIDQDGNWTYTLHNSPMIQGLGDDDFLSEVIVVQTLDGTEHTINLKIDGTNDVAEVSGDLNGEILEGETLTIAGKLDVSDVDHGESVFLAISSNGSYGQFEIDDQGNWSYEATDVGFVQSLGVGETVTENFVVQSADGTQVTVSVNITGQENGAIVEGDTSGNVQEDHSHVTSGKLTAHDNDAGENAFKASQFQGDYGQLTIDTSGNWTFIAANTAAFQALDEGDIVTEVFTVQTVDGTPQNITITVVGTEDAAVISGDDSGQITEDEVHSVSGKLDAVDADASESGFQASVQNSDYGTFSIDENGNWNYVAEDGAKLQALNNGDVVTETFTVFSKDGTAHDVNVSLNGVNEEPDPVSDKTEPELLEEVAAQFDGPKNFGSDNTFTNLDSFTISATFELNTLTGGTQSVLWSSQQYGVLLNGDDLYIYLRQDSGYMGVSAIRDAFDETGWHDLQIVFDHSTNELEIYVDGENVHSDSNSAVNLGGSKLSDVHAGQTPWGHKLEGQIADVSISDGVLPVDSSSSIYNRMYEMDNGDVLAQISLDQQVPGSGNGNNNPAEISGEDTGSVTEDGILSANGKLNVTDMDFGQSFFLAASIVGIYGTLTIDAQGNWNYQATDNALLQSLDEGDTKTETFTVSTADGTEHQLKINVNGTEDAAVISGDVVDAVSEDGDLNASGKLDVHDADNGESHFIADVEAGEYGSFAVDSSGNWSYTLDNASAQNLNTGDVIQEVFTVASADGTTQDVTVSVTGKDEQDPVDPGDPSGDVYTVHNSQELMDLLKSGVSGATIKMAPGVYDRIDIYDINPDQVVTITSLDPNNPAQIDDLNVSLAKNFAFEDLVFQSVDAAVASYGESIVWLQDTSNISFTNNEFLGREGLLEEGFVGLYVSKSDGIDVVDNKFEGVTRGAGFGNTENINVINNTVTNIGSDGFNFAAVKNVVIEGNHMSDIFPYGDHHPDYIQFWTAGTTTPTENVVIRNNFMIQGDGAPSQGIFITDQVGNLQYKNFVIENNVIYQSGYHGITIDNIDGAVVRNNTVLAHAETDNYLWIALENAEGAVVENNVSNVMTINGVSNFPEGPVDEFLANGNVAAWQTDRTGTVSYDEIFQTQMTQTSSDMGEFVLNPNIDAGANMDQMVSLNKETYGDNAMNAIQGTGSGEALFGFEGQDTLEGFDGNDTLTGGRDKDFLSGGDGSDTFVFQKISDSAAGAANRDVISDFDATDPNEVLSFKGLGNGNFNFIGDAEFHKPEYSMTEQIQILDDLASKFGSGSLSLGRHDQFFGLDEMTLSVTFEMNSLNGGLQHLLWNHSQYSVSIDNNDLVLQMRQADGSMQVTTYNNVFSATGWHDVQVTLDGDLSVWVDGQKVGSEDGSNISIGDASSWDLLAGGAFGKDLDGKIADVTVLDQAVEPSSSETVFERTRTLDDFDPILDVFDTSNSDAQVRFDEESGILAVDFDGDQKADMEVELVGVKLSDLDSSDFVF